MSDIVSRFYAACPQAMNFTEDEVVDCLATYEGRKFLGLDLKEAFEILLEAPPRMPDWKEDVVLNLQDDGIHVYFRGRFEGIVAHQGYIPRLAIIAPWA